MQPIETRRTLESIQPRYLARLEELVNVDCGTHNIEGVNLVGDRLSEMWSNWGWEVGRISQYEHGDCRIARIRGNGKGKVMLLGHLDTVYKDGVAAEKPMRFEKDPQRGDIVKRPGVCDMKSCILNGMYAMRALQLSGFDDFEEIVLVCNGDEEVGSLESKFSYEQIAKKMDAVLVLESARPGGEIVSARKGVGIWNIGIQSEKDDANSIVAMAKKILEVDALNGIREGVTLNPGVVSGAVKTSEEVSNNVTIKRWKIDVQGIESHAGVAPEKGANAIVELAHKILDVNSLNTSEVKINPIAIKGGTVRNTVPGRASAVLEIQANGNQVNEVEKKLAQMMGKSSVPNTSVELTQYNDDDEYIHLEGGSSNKADLVIDLRAFDKPSIEAIEDALRLLPQSVNGFMMTSDGRFTNPPMPRTQATELLIKLVKEIGLSQKIDVKDMATGGGSDANIIASWGIPVLDGLGPVGGDDHNADKEYIVIDSIVPRIRLLAGLIQNICANREQLLALRNSE